ncbi:MAG: alpha-amylase family glycosyl hydrolase, partial [Oscillospiraceae bacterium]
PEMHEKAKKWLVCAYALLFGLPGVPCIYYGDEIGMEGYRDPFNRGYFKWWRQDKFIQDKIKTMAEFRNSNPLFSGGGIYFAHSSANCVAFIRFENNKEVLVGANRGEWDESFIYHDKTYTIKANDFLNLSL